MTQLSPFQSSASVPAALLLPTAMQTLADAQDTASKEAPAGRRVRMIVQVVPFQDSERAPALLVPTAMQALAEVQDTPERKLAVALPGSGVEEIVQLVPSKDAASVESVPALSVY
jgi:hypothetical protein